MSRLVTRGLRIWFSAIVGAGVGGVKAQPRPHSRHAQRGPPDLSTTLDERYLGDVLIKRRNKITGEYLTAVNPVVSPRLDAGGRLTFDNAAFAAGVTPVPVTYRASWSLFDNATGNTRPLSNTESATTTIDPPAGLPTGTGSMIAVDISAGSQPYPAWRQPVRTHFRREGGGWKLVGLERLPETLSTVRSTR